MPGVKLDTFGGMVPAVDDRLLPDHAAAHSENTWLYAGRASGIPQLTLVKALTAGTTKVFRIPNNYTDAAHLDDSVWMEFEDPDTDVIRAPVLDDTFERYYWASSNLPPNYNTLARITAGNTGANAPWLLGVPQPAAALLGASGGVGLASSRAYVTTWVTAYGEEGPISDPVNLIGKVDDTWALTLTAADPGDLGGVGASRYLTHTRIYRTVTSSSGVTTYFLVAEIPVATLAYNDTLSDAVVAANNELESTNWIAPPTDLEGFIAMPNGILAGWRQNELWFSEPYRPHAWPAAYAIVVDYPIVGLGVTGQTLVVATQGFPVAVTGIHPSSMAQSKSSTLEPCLSRGSILSRAEGVYYASPNGLVFAGQGSVNNITRSLITKDKWTVLTTTASLRAAALGNAYFAFGGSIAGVFDPLSFDPLSFAQEDFTGAYVGVLIDPQDGRVGFSLLSDTTPVLGVQNDPWSGELFIVQGANLYRMDLSVQEPVRRIYKWRSKVFQSAKPKNLGVMKVFWNAPAAAPTAPGTAPAIVTLAEFPELPGGSTYGVVRAYADDTLVWTRDLVTSGELMKLPSGFKANYWQFEVETYVDVYSLQVAPTSKELATL